MVGPFIIAGVGMGLFFAPVANVVLSAVRPEEEGQASGANNALREVGGVFGVAVLAAIFAEYGHYPPPGQAYIDGLVPALWVGAAVLAVGALIALLIPKRRARAGGRGSSGLRRHGELRAEEIQHIAVVKGAVPAADA